MERVALFGGHVPPEVKYLAEGDNLVIRAAVRVVTASVLGHANRSEDEKTLLDAEDGRKVLAGVHRLVAVALRIPSPSWKQETFAQDLKDLKIPNEVASDLVDVVLGSRRPSVDNRILAVRKLQPWHLARMRWRVVVSISTTVLARALQPTIVLQLFLGDGRIETFEVSLTKFNALRCSVATVLKQLQQLERGHLFKIQA